MTSRNITEVFILMRNNAIQNRNMYDDRVRCRVSLFPKLKHMEALLSNNGFFVLLFQRPSDSEKLLQRSLRDAEEGLELQDDYASPPVWMDKLEEAQYTISKYMINEVLGVVDPCELKPNYFISESNQS